VAATIRSRLLKRNVPPFVDFQAVAKGLPRAIDYRRFQEGLD
jgi:hypothetical protein